MKPRAGSENEPAATDGHAVLLYDERNPQFQEGGEGWQACSRSEGGAAEPIAPSILHLAARYSRYGRGQRSRLACRRSWGEIWPGSKESVGILIEISEQTISIRRTSLSLPRLKPSVAGSILQKSTVRTMAPAFLPPFSARTGVCIRSWSKSTEPCTWMKGRARRSLLLMSFGVN